MQSRSKTSTSPKKTSPRRRSKKDATPQTNAAASPSSATRVFFVGALQRKYVAWLQGMSLPNINPEYVSLASILVAFLFVVAISQSLFFVAWVFLLVNLKLALLDGAIQAKFATQRTAVASQHAQLLALVADRASEGILFIIPPFFLPWFPVFVVNIFLSYASLRWQRFAVLPLRLIFLIVFTLQIIF